MLSIEFQLKWIVFYHLERRAIGAEPQAREDTEMEPTELANEQARVVQISGHWINCLSMHKLQSSCLISDVLNPASIQFSSHGLGMVEMMVTGEFWFPSASHVYTITNRK